MYVDDTEVVKEGLQSIGVIRIARSILLAPGLLASVGSCEDLKENVILGHLIPAGTAFKPYLDLKVKHLVEAPLPKEFEQMKEIEEAKEAEDRAEAAVKEALGIK